MKKFFVLTSLLLLSATLFAENLVMIKIKNPNQLHQLFQQFDGIIHYYNDCFVIASTENFDANEMVLLDKNAFSETDHYYLLYCRKSDQSDYIQREQNHAKIVYSSDNFLIVKPLSSNLMPAKNDGMVAIFNTEARLATSVTDFPVITEENPDIRMMMNQVEISNLSETVQHLQDYGTRRFNTSESTQAQNWLFEQYETLGFEVSLQGFKAGNYSQSSDNVIAVQRGTLYPDEYVVCGCHYDSYTFAGGQEPGADDNATGCAAVLETARILSQYSFERSIIYCSFSAEEVGLYGSAAFAQQCAWEGVNILGYFNNDMNGYLLEGTDIHIDLIYPNSANSIGDYYKNICNIYFPDMEVNHEQFMSGDSDHTSFNNNGYVGLYPFEDHQNYSPFIHTNNDLIGPSVNNWNLSKRYTEVNLSCVATLANLSSMTCPKVKNLTATIANQQVTLNWNATATNSLFDVYRDNQLIGTTTDAVFTETLPEGNYFSYGIIAHDGECVSGQASTDVVLSLETPELIVENAFNVMQDPSLKVSVSKSIGAKSYFVYRENGTLQTILYPFFRSIYLNSNIQPGQQYCFSAKAVGTFNGETIESETSELECGSSEVICPKVQNFAGQYKDGEVSLIWSSANYSEGYNVYRNDVVIGENIHSLYFIDHHPLQGNNCYYVTNVCYDGESENTEQICYEVTEIEEFENNISIYPNPAHDVLHISGDAIATISIYNTVGQLVKLLQNNSLSDQTINISDFPSGLYTIKIIMTEGSVVHKKVVIEH